jgi:hypothetical protein
MPEFQGCPFFLGQVGADNGLSLNNCLQGHNDPICFLSIKSCPEISKSKKSSNLKKKHSDFFEFDL